MLASSSLILLLAIGLVTSAINQTQRAVEKPITIPPSTITGNLDVQVAEGSGDLKVACHGCRIEANLSVAAGGPSLGGPRRLPTNWDWDYYVQDFDFSQDWVALCLPDRDNSVDAISNITVECDPGSTGFCQGSFTLSKKGGIGIEKPLELTPGLTVITPVVIEIRVNASKPVDFSLVLRTRCMTGALLVPLTDSKPELHGMNDGFLIDLSPRNSSQNLTLDSPTERLEMDFSMSVRLELQYTFTKDDATLGSAATYAAEIPRFDLSARQASNVTEYCRPLAQSPIYGPQEVYDNLTNLTRTANYNGLIVNGTDAGQTFGTATSKSLARQCYSYDAESKSLVWHTGGRTAANWPPDDAAVQHRVLAAIITVSTSLLTFFLSI